MGKVDWSTFAAVVTAVCWGVFVVVWVAGAIYNASRGPAVRTRTLGRAPVVIGVAAVVVVLRVVPQDFWDRLSVDSPWLRWPGLVILLLATAFAIWARVRLGTMWSADVVAKVGHELRTDGPYGIVRHPIYTGILGMLLGSALLNGLGRWTIALVGGAVLVEVKIRMEERLLARQFPREYAQYRQRVPALVPRLRKR